MNKISLKKELSSFQIIIIGFFSLIIIGTILLMLPISTRSGQWASFETALFTSTSAVCVTGLVIKDTALYWSTFGQAIILIMIQIGGLGIVSVAVFIAMLSGRKISLLERSVLQDSISAYQIGGIVKSLIKIFRIAFIVEFVGALILMPSFCKIYGTSGIWMSFFHSISAFCNAGFDIMGDKSGAFSSLTFFAHNIAVILPICLLIIIGGIGFLTWDDFYTNKFHLKKYRLQSKTIIISTIVLISVPAILLFLNEFKGLPTSESISLSLFQAITPRTAGFNTANLVSLSGASKMLVIVLMMIGGSPGSTAGGMKTTTIAVLFANLFSIIHHKKNAHMFKRRIEDSVIKLATTLLFLYISLVLISAFVISTIDNLPIGTCLFETASAIGTVGLSLGITPSLSFVSHLILIFLMFFGRVGGLTLLFAAINKKEIEVSQYPVEKINVG